jgi:outer membrane protein
MEIMRTQPCLVLTAFERAAPFLLAFILAAAGWAQDTSLVPPATQNAVVSSPETFDVNRYAKPRSHFPDPIAPYLVRQIAPPNLANTPRIDEFMHDGKLYISMNDAIMLTLENNLDIAIARYNLNIADTDIWRADAGMSISGVNSGVVQSTPGGGVGGLGGQIGSGQGGTSVAAGGAGAGAGGIVGSTLGTGPATPGFDPTLGGTLLIDRHSIDCNTPLCATQENTFSADFTYAQGFHWGTEMALTFNNSRLASNTVYDLLSPALNSSFQFKLTQHLLQGFGFAVNTRYIKLAKNNREISDVAFRLQIMSTVDQIENMYWNLVYAYENAKVQKEELAFAQKTLEQNKVQVEIGTLAPIEVVRAQTAIATDEQTLTIALTNLELQQLLMKNAISRSLVDPVLVDADVIPTSTMELPAHEEVVPTQDLVDEAFHHRPDLAEARINLANTELSNKAIRNSLLPSLDLSAFYGGAGLGGSPNSTSVCFSDPELCGLKKAPAMLPPVSYGSTLSQLVESGAPDKGVQLSLNIPIRNRAAQATQVRSEFEYRQSQLHMQQLENQVRIEVKNAQFGVQQNRVSVASAEAAVELARQSLEIEQKKYAIGASTIILVLQNQTALTQARATLLSAKAAYEKAEVELDRATGLIVEHAGILIADAEHGQVTHAPSIPHVVPQPANQPAQPQ